MVLKEKITKLLADSAQNLLTDPQNSSKKLFHKWEATREVKGIYTY